MIDPTDCVTTDPLAKVKKSEHHLSMLVTKPNEFSKNYQIGIGFPLADRLCP